MATIRELEEKRSILAKSALDLVQKDDATAKDIEQSKKLYAEAQLAGEQAAQLGVLEKANEVRQEVAAVKPQKPPASKFFNLGEFAHYVHRAGASKYRFSVDPRLREYSDASEPPMPALQDAEPGKVKAAWENKALAENVGATGGFLVPTEYREQLLSFDLESQPIATRAFVMPMRRRALRVPVLDQTGTTAGQPSWFGGIIASWTEEATQKDETEPAFRQMQLVAHKLICYTRASDELLDDAIISLDAWLQSEMGFVGAIRWYSEYAFLRGTGVGQPLGVITAVNSPTILVPRAGAGLAVADLVNMLEAFQGRSPVWHISRSQFAALMQLNGPAGNPSYVFMPNAREGAPATLFGYPIIWDDKSPPAGTQGDVLLADWSKYVIGQRQEVTFRSTDLERFRYDQTSFRMVYRVDGQPWMSAPITYQDGTTQVSPFVILGGVGGS